MACVFADVAWDSCVKFASGIWARVISTILLHLQLHLTHTLHLVFEHLSSAQFYCICNCIWLTLCIWYLSICHRHNFIAFATAFDSHFASLMLSICHQHSLHSRIGICHCIDYQCNLDIENWSLMFGCTCMPAHRAIEENHLVGTLPEEYSELSGLLQMCVQQHVKQCQMHNSKCTNAQLHKRQMHKLQFTNPNAKCTNAKCTNAKCPIPMHNAKFQMHKFTNSNAKWYIPNATKCQMHKAQMHRCTSFQCQCTNAQFQMHKFQCQMLYPKCQMLKCQMHKCSNANCTNAQILPMLNCTKPKCCCYKYIVG